MKLENKMWRERERDWYDWYEGLGCCGLDYQDNLSKERPFEMRWVTTKIWLFKTWGKIISSRGNGRINNLNWKTGMVEEKKDDWYGKNIVRRVTWDEVGEVSRVLVFRGFGDLSYLNLSQFFWDYTSVKKRFSFRFHFMTF